MAILRTRARAGAGAPVRLLVSARSAEETLYRRELLGIGREQADIAVIQTLTRNQPVGWAGLRRRVDKSMLADVAWPPQQGPRCFVCGPTGFVETVAGALLELGHDPTDIKTERFGPSGG
jgi:ferredoxin-NADP reductase